MTAFLARVLRRLYLEPLPVVFLDVSFSITYLDALSSWNAGLMHVNSNDLPIFRSSGTDSRVEKRRNSLDLPFAPASEISDEVSRSTDPRSYRFSHPQHHLGG